MEIAFIAAGLLALVLFCGVLYLGFRAGLRMGAQAARGQPPPRMRPVAAVRQAAADTKEAKRAESIIKAVNRAMKYTGDPQEPEKGDG